MWFHFLHQLAVSNEFYMVSKGEGHFDAMQAVCTLLVLQLGRPNFNNRAWVRHYSQGLYIFYPIFHWGLYCRAVSITDNLYTKQ